MALGASTRRDVLDGVTTTARRALVVTEESAHIDVRQAPQTAAAGAYSVVAMSDTDLNEGGRGRRTTQVLKRSQITLRYAHRLNPRNIKGSRMDAAERVDALELALRNADSETVSQFIDFTEFTSTEIESTSREWVYYDITVAARWYLVLVEPGAAA